MVTALVLLNVARQAINETAQALLDVPGVAEVYSVTGEYDLVAILHLPRYEDLAEVVTGKMVALQGHHTHTDLDGVQGLRARGPGAGVGSGRGIDCIARVARPVPCGPGSVQTAYEKCDSRTDEQRHRQDAG